MSVILRLAKQEDIPAVLAIVAEVVPIMNGEGNFQWDDEYPSEERFRLDVEREFLWVAEVIEDNSPKIIGMCAITDEPDPEYVNCGWDISQPSIVPHRLAVIPSHRRHGVAKLFLIKAEEIAREKNCKFLRVDTNKINIPMQNLFKNFGMMYSGEISLPCKMEGLRFVCYQKIYEN